MLVKCESFFIQAAKYSNISLSPHILARRHNNRGSNTEKNNKSLNLNNSALSNKKTSTEKNANIVKIILDKYPDFDPSWSPEVQKVWIESLTRLYERLNN